MEAIDRSLYRWEDSRAGHVLDLVEFRVKQRGSEEGRGDKDQEAADSCETWEDWDMFMRILPSHPTLRKAILFQNGVR